MIFCNPVGQSFSLAGIYTPKGVPYIESFTVGQGFSLAKISKPEGLPYKSSGKLKEVIGDFL